MTNKRWVHGFDDWAWLVGHKCWFHPSHSLNYYCLGDRMFHQSYGVFPGEERFHGSYTNNWHGGIQTNSFQEALEWLYKAKGDGHKLW